MFEEEAAGFIDQQFVRHRFDLRVDAQFFGGVLEEAVEVALEGFVRGVPLVGVDFPGTAHRLVHQRFAPLAKGRDVGLLDQRVDLRLVERKTQLAHALDLNAEFALAERVGVEGVAAANGLELAEEGLGEGGHLVGSFSNRKVRFLVTGATP